MTSTNVRPLWLGVGLAAAAFFATLALGSSGTSALSLSEYQKILAWNGYTATVGAEVSHATLDVDGVMVKVELLGTATVEFLDYGNRAALEADWKVEDGKGPEPRVATEDFDGKTLYWFNDSILVVDYSAPNDPLTARAAANYFLGLPDYTGQLPSPSPVGPTADPDPGGSPGALPNTGGQPDDEGDRAYTWAVGLAIVAAGTLAAAFALARRETHRS